MNKAVLEGLLFVVGEDGLTIEQICDVLNIGEAEAKSTIMELKKDYEDKSNMRAYTIHHFLQREFLKFLNKKDQSLNQVTLACANMLTHLFLINPFVGFIV